MSLPNPYIPETTYLLTRRTSERRFFLKPDSKTTSTLLFTLGTYAVAHTIKVHAFVFMSNHIHLVVSDMKGNLPDFTRDFYAGAARVMNRRLKRSESFWAAGEAGVTALHGELSIIEKIAYVLTNPVEAGIIPTHTDWRLKSTNSNTALVSTLGAIKGRKRYKLKRPSTYFKRKGSALKDTAFVILEPPPGMDEKQFHEKLKKMVADTEEKIQDKHRTDRVPFLGMTNALAVSTHQKPSSEEKEVTLNPRIAASSPRLRIEAKIRLKEFRRAHRLCRQRMKEGKPAVFPEGTYAMRRLYNVQIAPLEVVLRELSSV